MQKRCSEKSLLEIRLIQQMLDHFLSSLTTLHNPEIRQVALAGLRHALQAGYNLLQRSQSSSLLNSQTHLADIVVSTGGLNDTARSYLRSAHFEARLRMSPLYTQPSHINPSPIVPSAHVSDHPPFDPSPFFPCVVGSGRLAAAFLAAFRRLHVPNSHVTLISRAPLTHASPLATWMQSLDVEPQLHTYRQLTFDDEPLLAKPGPVFLLVKRKAFDHPSRRRWLQTLRQRNRIPVVVNLMAGGALQSSDEQELVVRANVLVSHPGAGNLLCHQPQMKGSAWEAAMPVLRAMGQLLPVSDQAIQAKLTFFTSTVPLVFLTVIDRLCFRDLPVEQANLLVLHSWAERYQAAARLQDLDDVLEPSDPALEAAALQYMRIYLDAM